LLAAGAVLLIGWLVGCANTTTTKFSRGKAGEIVVESPADVTITGLDARLKDGTRIKLKSYTSRKSPALTRAQASREAAAAGAITEGAVSGAFKGAKGF
jgi:hypothetical protein